MITGAMPRLRNCVWMACLILAVSGSIGSIGCISRPEKEVVVYSSLDRDFSEPILSGFTRHSEGTEVTTVFDVEASKTVGLVTRIESEKDRPRCDLFWNNEILHTIRLQQKGLLAPRSWDIPSNWPKEFRADDGSWVAIAARARVLLINTDRLPDPATWPTSVEDLAAPQWKGKGAMAYPLFGTTATHMAVLQTQLGDTESDTLFRQLAENSVVLSGNKQVALAVSAGEVDFGLTDTDDAIIEKEMGHPVAIVFPDQKEGQRGTLLLPNTIAVVRGSPHPKAAAMLADYLVSDNIESRLAMADSAQIPIRPGATTRSRIEPKEPVRWQKADYVAAASKWETLSEKLKVIFSKPSSAPNPTGADPTGANPTGSTPTL